MNYTSISNENGGIGQGGEIWGGLHRLIFDYTEFFFLNRSF
jgi:hypothetical protein